VNIPHQYQLFTAAESRELDRRTIEEFGIDGFTLMEIAGTRATDFILHQFPGSAKGLVLCGRGNNAGDALVVSRILSENGFHLTIVFVDGDQNLSPDCEKNYQLLKALNSSTIKFSNSRDALIETYGFVIDGMLGTGLNSEIRSPYKEVIEQVNGISCTKFAMDIPTGLHADDGRVLGSAFKADYTLAFGTLKHGFYQNEGYENCGKVIYCELPFPSSFKNSSDYLLNDNWLNKVEVESEQRTHKYDGGVVYIIAGSEGLTGAAILASLSAWNTGVGAVVLITPKGLLPVYDKQLIHIIKKPVGKESDLSFTAEHLDEVNKILSEKSGVLLIGPGLGRDSNTIQFVHQILSTFEGDVVIDADALFTLSELEKEIKPVNSKWILTPHPGELKQLSKSEDDTRIEVAKSLSKSLGSTVLSKGLPSIISSSNGQSISTDYDTRIFSRAGFGDVLAGKVAGYLLLTKNRELACCLALSDGKTKAVDYSHGTSEPLEPLDII
jgi:NAD(P)H-hydrate epimerase